MVKALQRLQRRLERPLLEILADMGEGRGDMWSLGISEDLPELAVVRDLCDSGDTSDLRNLRLAVLMATEEEPYETFISKSFTMFDTEQGDDRLSVSGRTA